MVITLFAEGVATYGVDSIYCKYIFHPLLTCKETLSLNILDDIAVLLDRIFISKWDEAYEINRKGTQCWLGSIRIRRRTIEIYSRPSCKDMDESFYACGWFHEDG